jgi:hypothetical protein
MGIGRSSSSQHRCFCKVYRSRRKRRTSRTEHAPLSPLSRQSCAIVSSTNSNAQAPSPKDHNSYNLSTNNTPVDSTQREAFPISPAMNPVSMCNAGQPRTRRRSPAETKSGLFNNTVVNNLKLNDDALSLLPLDCNTELSNM